MMVSAASSCGAPAPPCCDGADHSSAGVFNIAPSCDGGDDLSSANFARPFCLQRRRARHSSSCSCRWTDSSTPTLMAGSPTRSPTTIAALLLVISTVAVVVFTSSFHLLRDALPESWIDRPTFRYFINKPTLEFVIPPSPAATDENGTGNKDQSKACAVSTFRLLQVADIHLGENSWTDWGPEQDEKTRLALDSILNAENPDLIVLTGDQLTANNIKKNATAYVHKLARNLGKHKIPWITVFGNHDDSPFVEIDNATIVADEPETSRRQLAKADMKHRLSLTKLGPTYLNGVSNYWLEIYHNQAVAARILVLDSGGGSIPQSITKNQVDWFWETWLGYYGNAGSQVPIFAFMHIPSSIEEFEYDGSRCGSSALVDDSGVAAVDRDAGIVSALQAAGNVQLLGVGHCHGYDYCCKHGDNEQQNGGGGGNYADDGSSASAGGDGEGNSSLHLCFGRHTGYGGYGKWDRGARVYKLDVNSCTGEFVGWTSYVRMETGEIVNEYDPSGS